MSKLQEILGWKPINYSHELYPHRVHFSGWDFKLDGREFSPKSQSGNKEFTYIDHGPEFQAWADEYKIAGFQIAFWGDSRYRYEAANDEIQTVWSFCFERERDAILFKLKWV